MKDQSGDKRGGLARIKKRPQPFSPVLVIGDGSVEFDCAWSRDGDQKIPLDLAEYRINAAHRESIKSLLPTLFGPREDCPDKELWDEVERLIGELKKERDALGRKLNRAHDTFVWNQSLEKDWKSEVLEEPK